MNTLFLSATHAANSNTRTGIQSTVRGLVAGLESVQAKFELVSWSKRDKCFTRLTPPQRIHLGAAPGLAEKRRGLKRWPKWLIGKRRSRGQPIHLHPAHAGKLKGAWLLLPEVMYRGEFAPILDYARSKQMHVAGIFHDAIPLSHPELVRRDAAEHHLEYVAALARADIVVAVSNDAAEAFKECAKKYNLPVPDVYACPEPAEVIGIPRIRQVTDVTGGRTRILCVSTLEPRKNHRLLIEAFNALCASRPDLNLQLDIVGDIYVDAEEIAEFVRQEVVKNSRIRWHGPVPSPQLCELYSTCDFTVYPSFLEGFGLPIAESLWFGKPSICANFGAMAEIGEGGGCLMVDVCEAKALGSAMLTLATDDGVRRNLAQEATSRELATWSDYAISISDILREKSSRILSPGLALT